jgi:hypothetical protein
MKKYLFGIFAVAIAIGFSAFTSPKNTNLQEFEVWYEVHPSTGVALAPEAGQQSEFGCSGESVLCARSLTFNSNPSLSEVIDNLDDTYTIKQGIDITVDYNDQRLKAE